MPERKAFVHVLESCEQEKAEYAYEYACEKRSIVRDIYTKNEYNSDTETIMATVYFTKWILLPNHKILENGAIAVSGNVITSIGSRSGVKRSGSDRIVNCGNILIMPGLINVHTHLEEGIIRGNPREPDETFASFFAKKNTRMRQAQARDIESAVQLGVRESLASGTTTVVDSSRRGISTGVLINEPIRSWIIQEMHPDSPSVEEHLFNDPWPPSGSLTPRVNSGIGPYALFSLLPANHKRSLNLARERSCPWMVHVAESSEELQAFSEQNGDLFFQITRNRPWPYGRNPAGPMHYAISNNFIPNGAICIHCNYVNGYELALLSAKQVAVAISMRYSTAQGHKFFPLDIAIKRGLLICVATESIADAETVSLFDELYFIKSHYPHIAAGDLLDWVTRNPARALGAADRLGTLEPGKLADFIGVTFQHDPGEDMLEALLAAEPSVRLVVVDGEEVIVDC